MGASHGHAGMAKGIEGSTAGRNAVTVEPDPEDYKEVASGRQALFDREQLSSSVEHGNEICRRYGVKILSINLISASPSDPGLLDALSQGAVATVAAEQMETAARGQAQADAAKIRAQGDAEAEALRANGSKKAADLLES